MEKVSFKLSPKASISLNSIVGPPNGGCGPHPRRASPGIPSLEAPPEETRTAA